MLVFLESDYDNFPLVSTEQITITFSVQLDIVFTARCTLVQSAVLRSHVVCLSVCNVGEL